MYKPWTLACGLCSYRQCQSRCIYTPACLLSKHICIRIYIFILMCSIQPSLSLICSTKHELGTESQLETNNLFPLEKLGGNLAKGRLVRPNRFNRKQHRHRVMFRINDLDCLSCFAQMISIVWAVAPLTVKGEGGIVKHWKRTFNTWMLVSSFF